MLHAKVMTVDGIVSNIGSANLNPRSVAWDEEVNLVALDPTLTAELDRDFDADLERSVRIDPERWNEPPAAPAGGRGADPPHPPLVLTDAQLRGTSLQGSSLSMRGSPGRPRTRSPRMLRMISEVPPSMELARERRNILRDDPGGPSRPMISDRRIV